VLIDGGALGIEQRDVPRDGAPRRIGWRLQLPMQLLKLLLGESVLAMRQRIVMFIYRTPSVTE